MQLIDADGRFRRREIGRDRGRGGIIQHTEKKLGEVNNANVGEEALHFTVLRGGRSDFR